jgi:uncharacterized protein YcbK (DUF882 family)
MGDLSPHFSRREFRCRCGCGLDAIDPAVVRGLEKLRALIPGGTRGIRVTSGCRCPKHNLKVSKSNGGQHVRCKAADIYVVNMPPLQLYRLACRVPEFDSGGIGLYPQNGFVHVDVRTRRARWGYLDGREVGIDAAIEAAERAAVP